MIRGVWGRVSGMGVTGISRSIRLYKKMRWPEKYSGESPETAAAPVVGRRPENARGRERYLCGVCVLINKNEEMGVLEVFISVIKYRVCFVFNESVG